MSEIKIECPSCGQPIELPEDHARRGLNCPACYKFFTPSLAPAPATCAPKNAAPGWEEHNLQLQKNKIRQGARAFELIAVVFLVMATLWFFGALMFMKSQENYSFIPAGYLVGLALW